MAVCTAAIYPLKPIAPDVSLGVVYLMAVIGVSIFWGFWLGLFTAVLSAAAFNFFHIPPTGQFTIQDSENWVALGAFLVAAAFVSSLAELGRARAAEADLRRREADLMAELARVLLGRPSIDAALPVAAERIATALELPSASLELGAAADYPGRLTIPLSRGESRVGTLVLPAEIDPESLARVQERLVPGLEALLAAAIEREALVRTTVETEALRRSDDIKTALLRTVSHDLRTPLTAIRAAAEDDYVTKPFGPRELVARLNAALRRAGEAEEEPAVTVDGLEIDLAAHTVRRDCAAVHLHPDRVSPTQHPRAKPGQTDDAPSAPDGRSGDPAGRTTRRRCGPT